MEKNILLIGFMGTGKSTVSGELHERTGMEEIDLDEYISEKAGMTINEIFEQKGEAYFRDFESLCLTEAVEGGGKIISCGGGTVIRRENVTQMKQNGRVVLLTALPETVYQRVKENNDRPVLNGNMNVAYIAGLMEKRKEYYRQAADVTVSTDGKSVEEICSEIQKLLF